MAKRKTQVEKDKIAAYDIGGILDADVSCSTKEMTINQVLRRTTVTRKKQNERTEGCDVDHTTPLKDLQKKLINKEMSPEEAVAEAHKLGEKRVNRK